MAKQRISNDAIGTLVLALLYSAVFVFTNLYDWDYVFSTLEVDLRSWVIDGKMPSWSYQFCAGSSRIGDPQSYGMSPLMILPILFGSFWGAKSLLFISVLTGVHYLKKMIRLILGNTSSFSEHVYILGFLTSNFFLFHFNGGHLSFSSHFYVFPLLYICLRLVSGSRVTLVEYCTNSIFLFILMSGGFYQASIYFILPLAIAFGLYLILHFKEIDLKDVAKLCISSLLPLLLSLYRVIPVIQYQKKFPRTLLGETEWHNLYHQFLHFFVPINRDKYFFPYKNQIYHAGEDSYFGAISVALLILVIFKFKTFLATLLKPTPLVFFSFCLIFTGMLFSLGGDELYFPFKILNFLSSGSIRVSSRFNFLSYLGLFFIFINLVKNSLGSSRFNKVVLIVMGMVSLLTPLQFYDHEEMRLSLFQLQNVSRIEANYEERMQMIHVGKMRGARVSHMYKPILLGFSFPNCYQPMARKIFLIEETVNKEIHQYDVHFMDSAGDPQDERCLKNSYFTQSELYIDPNCHKNSRVHLNFIEPKFLKKFNIRETNHGYRL